MGDTPNTNQQNGGKGPGGENNKGLKPAAKPEEGTPVGLQKNSFDGKNLNNYMWIEGTGKSKHLKAGEKHEVHRISGEKLISKGAAKETTPPAKPKAAAKKDKKDEDEDD